MEKLKLEPVEETHKIEKHRDFSLEQESFLDDEFEKMLEDALLEEDFRGKIPDEIIDKCLLEVERYKNIFLQQNKIDEIKGEVNEREDQSPEYKKISEYFEALIYNKLEKWIPGSIVFKTSNYDDFKGADFIVENKNRELSLKTDVTFSSNKGLLKKLDRIVGQIKKGGFTQPIFYESVNEEAEHMPQVIIAIEREKIIGALKLWADGQGDLLNEHPMMVKILLEIEAQLEAFSLFAKASKKRDVASSCNDALAQIQKIIIKYENIIKKYQNIIEDDRSYKTIISFCDDLKSEASKMIAQEH